MSDIYKVIGIWDSHYPWNINLDPFLEYAKDQKPNEFIFGGDNWSLDVISHWNDQDFKNVGFDNVRRKLHEEADGFNDQLDKIVKIMGKAKITYIMGNHEDWISQFSEKYPQMDDLSMESMTHLRKRGFNVIPFEPSKVFYKIGKLYICHGHQFGSEYTAKQAVVRCHHSVAFGHHHSEIMWVDFSDVNAYEKHRGIQIPCYCHRAPGYGKGRPNRWTNGFLWANFKKSGNFSANVQSVNPKNGSFITQDGVEYE